MFFCPIPFFHCYKYINILSFLRRVSVFTDIIYLDTLLFLLAFRGLLQVFIDIRNVLSENKLHLKETTLVLHGKSMRTTNYVSKPRQK